MAAIKSQLNKDYIIWFSIKSRNGKVKKKKIEIKINSTCAKCSFPCRRCCIEWIGWVWFFMVIRRLDL